MREIHIHSPKHGHKIVLVDDIDYDWLNAFRWHFLVCRGLFYAKRHIAKINDERKQILMHREIMGLADPKVCIDHKDRNGLNNQRSNLRIATQAQNRANSTPKAGCSSKYLGVSWCNKNKKWMAKIQKYRVQKYLGYFDTESEAAIAYNNAAIEWHGNFSNLNKI